MENTTTVFMAFYFDINRSCEHDVKKLEQNLKIALNKENEKILPDFNHRYVIRKWVKDDLSTVVGLYQQVFASYPFPIHDPDYLFHTMQSDVEYFCIEADDQIIAVSAVELDKNNLNAEMTDFVTSPIWRSKNLAQHLLAFMEKKIKMKTAYTIARALSIGMNITFCKSGYNFAGRLRNNTNISGSIESMAANPPAEKTYDTVPCSPSRGNDGPGYQLGLDISMINACMGDLAKYTYPIKSVLNTGVPVMLESDAPVADPNPMAGIYSAVTRAGEWILHPKKDGI